MSVYMCMFSHFLFLLYHLLLISPLLPLLKISSMCPYSLTYLYPYYYCIILLYKSIRREYDRNVSFTHVYLCDPQYHIFL